MDERRDEYGFCPKCGAVMQNGVCQSCGYGKRLSMPGSGNSTASGMPYQSAPRKKGMSVSVKIAIVLGIILAILLAVFAGLTIRAVIEDKDSSSKLHIDGDSFDDFDSYEDDGYGEWDDDYDYDYDSSFDEYVPSPDDAYYKEFADSTVQGLSYEIEWRYLSLYPDADDRSEYYSLACPAVRGGEEELMNRVNEHIQDVVCKYEAVYTDYEYGVTSTCYVTYMGEDKLSLAVKNELGTESEMRYEIDAVTIDMTTGEVIPYGDMVQADEELVKRFRSQDSVQNGTVEFVDGLTDEELLDYISDDEKRIVFLSPVGTELGFNYDGGWVTVTLKDQAL